uniref:Cysteine-rich venom protein ENH1-like n=1 Tax=Sinocyclocheilus anshuiensis TaxID=1608454 RepID=A0A671KVB7_9TELE
YLLFFYFFFVFCFLQFILRNELIVLPFPLTGVCTDLPSVQQEIVDVHNAYRRAVEPTASNMLKMSWSDAVAQSAQGWIDQCNVTHGPPSSRMIDGMLPSITVINNYEYPTGSTNGQVIGHYIQVVWYSSYEVGCAVAQCGSSYFYGCFIPKLNPICVVHPFPPYLLGNPCAACPHDCEDGLCTNPCPYINTFSNCDELKEMATCDHSLVSQWCPASCLCEDKIVPIARK